MRNIRTINVLSAVVLCASTHASALSVMPMGDSLTYGTGSTTGAAYRGALQELLTQAGVSFDFVGTQNSGTYGLSGGSFDADHAGYRGAEAASLKAVKWPDEVPASDSLIGFLDSSNTWGSIPSMPDVILLHIGTNSNDTDPLRTNDPHGLGSEPFNSATNQLRRLFSYFADQPGLGGTKILLAKLVPKVQDNGSNAAKEARYQNIAAYNALLDDLVAEFATSADPAEQSLASRITLVDMFNAGSWVVDSDNDGIPDAPNLVSGLLDIDGTHLTDAGYELMAQTWYDAMLSTQVIPEPGTLVLGGLGGLLLLRRRRAHA